MSSRDDIASAIDFAFLDRQTFGDAILAREVLDLFASQAASLAPTLPTLSRGKQTEVAHLLKGSCQGIGAMAAADLLQRYGDADPAARLALQPAVDAALTAARTAIARHLAAT